MPASGQDHPASRTRLGARWSAMSRLKKIATSLGAAFIALVVLGSVVPKKDTAAADPTPATNAAADPGWSPRVHDDAATTTAGQPVSIPVLLNDTVQAAHPVSGATAPDLTLHTVGTPANGSATVENGAVRYSPAAGFTGTDTLTYTAAAGTGRATANITVTVTPAPAPAPPSTTDPTTNQPTAPAATAPEQVHDDSPATDSGTTPGSQTSGVIRHAGEFCSTPGDLAVSDRGHALICKKAKDGRDRWLSH